jgi:DNA-binding NarL/FixJ family response regulator
MITVTQKINERKALLAKLAELDNTIEAERDTELAALPEQYGFEDPRDFAEAVLQAASGRKRRGYGSKARKNRVAGMSIARPAKKRSRATITDEMKAQVKTLVEKGLTGADIAREVGISLPSVQNIKKSFGLVKARS